MANISKEILKKYALNYLNRYASSKKNLEFFLKRKISKFTNDQYMYKSYIKDILSELEKHNIINDESFANSVAFNYARIGKSKKFIKYNLIKKGINSNDIQNAIKKLEDEIPDFEIKSAINFAKKKKLGRFGKSNSIEKDLSKMARAGFSYNIIKKVLN